MTPQILFLCLSNDIFGVLGLSLVEPGEVSTAAATATTAAIAPLGDIAVGAGLDIVVGYVAAVRGLVPDIVAIDTSAGGLAADRDIGSQLVGFESRRPPGEPRKRMKPFASTSLLFMAEWDTSSARLDSRRYWELGLAPR